MKEIKTRGFQKNSILCFAAQVLEEAGEPLSYQDLYEYSINNGFKPKGKINSSSVFRHRINEDIARRKEESVFQIVGFRIVGLRKWNLPIFDLQEYKQKIKEEKERTKKVSIINATIEALEKAHKPLRIKEIFKYVIERENVKFKSKTPFKTVNSNITHEINKKGEKSRFVRISKGVIALRKWSSEQTEYQQKEASTSVDDVMAASSS